jgi:hypothetical protein
MTTTPNMGLAVSVPSVTTGPTWAQNIEDNHVLIDAHDHTTGKGAPIDLSALTITADIAFGGFSPTNVASVSYTSGTINDTTSVTYISGSDLYFNNDTGFPIALTRGTHPISDFMSGTQTAIGVNGNTTINKYCGTVNIASGSTSVVVTNNLVAASGSLVQAWNHNNGSNAEVISCSPAAGSFTIRTTGCSAATAFAFHVINII